MTADIENVRAFILAEIEQRQDGGDRRYIAKAQRALDAFERFVGPIWDPACGGGNICDEGDRRGYIVVGSDIVKRVAESRIEADAPLFAEVAP